MKPAILVALLFRTLDAFRIFDNIFILTSGGHDTGSVSILGYDNLFTALNLGIGSAISVLIFICVAIIAFLFIKGFGAAGARIGPEATDGHHREAEGRLGHRQHPRDRARAHPGAVDRVAVVQGPVVDHRRLVLARRSGPGTTTRGIFKTSEFTRALVNSIGIALISTFIAVRVRVDGRLRRRPAASSPARAC